MNEYLKSVSLLDSWWQSLDEEWKSFLCANYYYTHERRSFYDLSNSILRGNFMDDWMTNDIAPSIIHYAFTTEKFLLDCDLIYINEDETGSFNFKIQSITPTKDLHNLKELKITGDINDFTVEILKDLINLSILTIDECFIRQIPDILILNLPKLEKIIVETHPFYDRKEYDFLMSLVGKTRIKIEELYTEENPRLTV